MAQTVNNFFQCRKYLVVKATFSDLFPYLLYRIHFRRIGRNVKQNNIFRQLQACRLMPGSAITAKQNNIVSIFLRQMLQKDIHTNSIAIGHNEEMTVASQWFHCSVGIAILPNMVAWHTGPNPLLTPTVFGLVDPAKSSLILKHEPDVLPLVENFQVLDCSVNFFEAAISSSLAFLGCLLRGMTFRHPWRFSTK